MWGRERIYEAAVKRMPGAVGAWIDQLRPSLAASWGGPLNGQTKRRQVVRELARAVDFDLVIETGTYRGTSTEFFAAVFGVPVHTVESNLRFYRYSSQRLAVDPSIAVTFGDSRTFLRDLADEHGSGTPFIYLDAHWEVDLPLAEELAIIRDGWKSAVVMIDDFAVPGDPGYGFDDYGPGRALVEGYLPPMPGWRLLYPAAPSAMESGERRGSAVLLPPALAEVAVDGLRLGRRW